MIAANKIIILTGPTASNKSQIAEKLKEKYNVTIINADSKQVYRQIPLITCQPEIKPWHKLYGCIDITEQTHYSAAQWSQDAVQAIKESFQSNTIPLIVGGSGLYISALINGLFYAATVNQQLKKIFLTQNNHKTTDQLYNELQEKDCIRAQQVNKNDRYRIINALFLWQQTGKNIMELKAQTKPPQTEWDFITYATMPPREELYQNIDQRTIRLFEMGAKEEIEKILPYLQSEDGTGHAVARIIGVQEIAQHINGLINIDRAIQAIQQQTRNYAKRQCTWIRNQLKNAIIITNECDIIL